MTRTEQAPQMSSSRALKDLIEQERRRRGWTYRDLQDKTGVSRSALFDMERGKTRTPHLETLGRIAVAFEMELADVLLIVGFPVNPIKSNEDRAQRLAALAEVLPRVEQVVDDLLRLDPSQQEGVIAYIEAVKGQATKRRR